MSKEEIGELYKVLGKLRYVITKYRNQERELELFKDEEKAILLLLKTVPIIEEHIKG